MPLYIKAEQRYIRFRFSADMLAAVLIEKSRFIHSLISEHMAANHGGHEGHVSQIQPTREKLENRY